MSSVNLVTGLLDIGRADLKQKYRDSFQSYRNSLDRLLALENPITIHADACMNRAISNYKRNHTTKLVLLDPQTLRDLPQYSQIQCIRKSKVWQNQAEWLSSSPHAALELYNPLVMQKVIWLADAARLGDPDAIYMWLDAGIHRHLKFGEHGFVNTNYFNTFTKDTEKVFMFAIPYEKNSEVHGFERKALAQYCGTDYVDRCCRGGFFGGTASAILRLEAHYKNLMNDTLAQGLMGTEESLLTILSYRYPELVDVHLLTSNSVPELFGQKRSSVYRLTAFFQATEITKSLSKRALKKLASIENNALGARATDRILTLPPFVTNQESLLDLHILLCERDVISGLWALRSFLHYSQLSVRLTIHDDGSLQETHINQISAMFPKARLITFEQARYEMEQILAPYPNAYRFRITEYFWSAIKLIDFAHFSQGRAFIALDADVLLFKRPQEILNAITQGKGFFMSDWQNAYTWPLERWPAVIGVKGIPQVNVGLFGIPREFYDLNMVERCLAAYYKRRPCPRSYWLEQTIWTALFSQHQERMLRLPETYQISDKHSLTPHTNSHHYVNDTSLSRLNFTRRGVPHLIDKGFLKEATDSI